MNVTNDLAAPVSGKVIPLEQVKDETFASGMLGQGVAIEQRIISFIHLLREQSKLSLKRNMRLD